MGVYVNVFFFLFTVIFTPVNKQQKLLFIFYSITAHSKTYTHINTYRNWKDFLWQGTNSYKNKYWAILASHVANITASRRYYILQPLVSMCVSSFVLDFWVIDHHVIPIASEAHMLSSPFFVGWAVTFASVPWQTGVVFYLFNDFLFSSSLLSNMPSLGCLVISSPTMTPLIERPGIVERTILEWLLLCPGHGSFSCCYFNFVCYSINCT